jgi:hypothetical protein
MLKKIIAGGQPGAEAAALMAAREAGLLTGGWGSEKQVPDQEGSPGGRGSGEGQEGQAEKRRKNRKRAEEVRRNCKEAGASFFITCGGYNPGNRVAKAAARFRKPYSSIDYEDPEQSSQRLLNFLRAYRPAVLHITGKADWTRGREFEGALAKILARTLARAAEEGLIEPALGLSA